VQIGESGLIDQKGFYRSLVMFFCYWELFARLSWQEGNEEREREIWQKGEESGERMVLEGQWLTAL